MTRTVTGLDLFQGDQVEGLDVLLTERCDRPCLRRDGCCMKRGKAYKVKLKRF